MSQTNSYSHLSPEAESVSAFPAFWLEIRRGKSQFPKRPLQTDRFLIGAGSLCHLQLGGDEIPMLHSLLLQKAGELWIEALVPQPELKVNGKSVQTVQLTDGDQIEIGRFSFQVGSRKPQTVSLEDLQRPLDVEKLLASEREQNFDPTAASARELVDQLEFIEHAESQQNLRQNLGALALLQAVQQASGKPEGKSEFSHVQDGSWQELHHLSQQLEARTKRLGDREIGGDKVVLQETVVEKQEPTWRASA